MSRVYEDMHVKDVHGKTIFIGFVCVVDGVLVVDRVQHDVWHLTQDKLMTTKLSELMDSMAGPCDHETMEFRRRSEVLPHWAECKGCDLKDEELMLAAGWKEKADSTGWIKRR